MPALRSSAPLGTAEGPPGPPSDEELIVEIELAPGAVSLRPALIDNTAAFTGAVQAGAAPPDIGLGAVLRRHRLIEARPTHGDTQVRQDEQRTAAVRAAAAIGAASPEQVAARERLPSKASFITLRFPPGTDVAKVTEELRQLPEVDKAVWRPRAAPPMAVGVALPADPLIGTGPIVVDAATQLETAVVPASHACPPGLALFPWRQRRHRRHRLGLSNHPPGACAAPSSEPTTRSTDGSDVTTGAHAAHGTAVLGIAGARANGDRDGRLRAGGRAVGHPGRQRGRGRRCSRSLGPRRSTSCAAPTPAAAAR